MESEETNLIIVDVIMGAWKARVGLTPLDMSDNETWERVKKLVNKEPPVEIPQAKIDKMNKSLRSLLQKNSKCMKVPGKMNIIINIFQPIWQYQKKI